jgi:phage N-6-adenine-methyltransferase
MLGQLIVQEDIRLPAIIDRARTRLAEARTSAEVLEARAAAKAALHNAKLQKAANETQADCLSMIKRAELRMADEIDAAQERGEVAKADGTINPGSIQGVRSPDTLPATYEELGISRQRVGEWRELRDAGEHVIDEAIQAALDEGRAPTNADIQRAVKGSHYRTQFTGENEWYTPAEYVEAARACLGSIDLDPATAPIAQKTVRAARFLTRDDDGLRHDWRGRIWLNPPYAQPDISRFIDKLLAEIGAGRATQAILLTHNYTDTGWFHAAAATCAAICFTRGRIRFVSATGEVAAPTQGQAFFYFGPAAPRFHETFGGFGFIR